MNLVYSAFLIINIFSSIFGLPIYEHGPAIVIKQNKQIIFSPENETNFNIVKAIVPPPPPPVSPGPINDIMPAKYITIDGIVIYTQQDITPFIIE
jgi:hypothetical protein